MSWLAIHSWCSAGPATTSRGQCGVTGGWVSGESLGPLPRTTILLRTLGLHAVPLHGKMPQVSHRLSSFSLSLSLSSQAKRLGALNKFKSKSRSILVATDVASRGLDISHVDVVVNFDIPTHSKVSLVFVGLPWYPPPPHRTTFTEWGEQPELDARDDPSPLSPSELSLISEALSLPPSLPCQV